MFGFGGDWLRLGHSRILLGTCRPSRWFITLYLVLVGKPAGAKWHTHQRSTLALVQWVTLDGNQLSGTLPSWSSLGSTLVYVQPGNDGMCGTVSASIAAPQCV